MEKHARTGGFIVALVAVSVTATACTDDLTSLNENPNFPTDVEVPFFATAALVETAKFAEGTLNQSVGSYWVQHMAPVQYAWDDRYDIRQDNIEAQWEQVYTGPLQDWKQVIEKAEDRGRTDQVAAAKVMQAFLFQIVTDSWGDVPYSQANTGLALENGGTTTPVFDPQQEIYESLIQELEEASAGLSGSGDVFGAADFIYGGDPEGWRRFANSLRLRLAMRLSEVDPALGRQVFSSAVAAGVFESLSDEATFEWEATSEHENPWCDNCGGVENIGGRKVSVTMVDILKSLSDPRLGVYVRPNNEGEFVGLPNGLQDGHGIPFGAASPAGEVFMRSQTRPSILLGYDEVLFLQAEAAERGWTSGDPGALYESAIRANLARYDIPDAEVAAYLAQPEVAYAGELEQIALQKWISLFTRGIEAWAEYRRTGVPDLVPGPAAVLNQVPSRVPYPGSESSLNAANLEEARSRQNGASMISPVWWATH